MWWGLRRAGRGLLVVLVLAAGLVLLRADPGAAWEYPLPYVTVTPARLADTRPGATTVDWVAAGVGAIGPRGTLSVPTANRGGLPGFLEGWPNSDGYLEAEAVVVNVTALGATAPTHLTVHSGSYARPAASNLNLVPGETVSNVVVVPMDDIDTIKVFNNAGTVHVIVDVQGYYAAHAGEWTPTTPRLLDTRPGGPTADGQYSGRGRLSGGTTLTLPVLGRAGLPATGSAAVVTITAIEPTAPTHLTAYPAGAARPNASNLNVAAGQTRAAFAIVPLGSGGAIRLFNNAGSTHLVVDVVGVIPLPHPTVAGYTPVVPARLVDTRPGFTTVDGVDQGAGALGPGQTLVFAPAGRGGVPEHGVGAVALNVTLTGGSAATHATVWPTGVSRPATSNLNAAAGATVPNVVLAKLGPDGTVSLRNNSGSAHVIVDVSGWMPYGGGAGYATDIDVGLSGNGCATLGDGRIACFGAGSFGTGEGATDVVGLPAAEQVVSGSLDTCARLVGGSALCWSGEGRFPVPEIGDAVDIDPGDWIGCAARATGDITCWEYDWRGEPLLLDEQPAVSGAIDIALMSTGGCALLAGGGVRCWDMPLPGQWPQVGVLDIAGLTQVEQLDAEGSTTCARLADGSVWCFTATSTTPVQLAGVSAATDMAVGASGGCVLQAGSVWCWGSNVHGELGGATGASSSATPLRVPGLSGVVAIGAGGDRRCAVNAVGQVLCWGTSASFAPVDHRVPTEIPGL